MTGMMPRRTHPLVARASVRRYVALGDSYTIGTSVEQSERFPDQLVAALGSAAHPLELVANLGVDGYTSADLVREELPALDALQPSFVSVLIGVNDVVQGVPLVVFERQLAGILDDLLSRLSARAIVALTIPDYTVTPAGAAYGDPSARRAEIGNANDVLRALAQERSIALADIHDLSLRAAADGSLVASDGLHPSGAQYALWVGRLAPVVRELLAG